MTGRRKGLSLRKRKVFPFPVLVPLFGKGEGVRQGKRGLHRWTRKKKFFSFVVTSLLRDIAHAPGGGKNGGRKGGLERG